MSLYQRLILWTGCLTFWEVCSQLYWAFVPRCELQPHLPQEFNCTGRGYLMSMTNPSLFTLDRSSPGKAPPGAGGSQGTCVPRSELPHVPSCLLSPTANAYPGEVTVLWCHLSNVIQAEELSGGLPTSSGDSSFSPGTHQILMCTASWLLMKQNRKQLPLLQLQGRLCSSVGSSEGSTVLRGLSEDMGCAQSSSRVLFIRARGTRGVDYYYYYFLNYINFFWGG